MEDKVRERTLRGYPTMSDLYNLPQQGLITPELCVRYWRCLAEKSKGQSHYFQVCTGRVRLQIPGRTRNKLQEERLTMDSVYRGSLFPYNLFPVPPVICSLTFPPHHYNLNV